jgi:hypothetical protein
MLATFAANPFCSVAFHHFQKFKICRSPVCSSVKHVVSGFLVSTSAFVKVLLSLGLGPS